MGLNRTLFLAVGALACFAARALAQPQDTSYTYQGSLSNAGAPTAGDHDIRVRLFDAASGGNQVGATLCADNVGVADGRFTIVLDFGAQFTGQKRWLEIEVRADAGTDCANASGFTLLTPRQELTARPTRSTRASPLRR